MSTTCQRQSGCPAPQPGHSAGGCAFDGASITLTPIADAAHIVHGPINCAGNSWGSRGSLSSGPTIFQHGFTTDLHEKEIIFGGEQRLFATICEVAQRYKPAAIFVYATCVTAMIGEDIAAVCSSAANHTGLPVIEVPAPGFAGTKNRGNIIAGQVLLDKVIGTREPDLTTSMDVNLIGEYNIAGELWNVTPLLAHLGIRMLACVTGDARFADIATAHRARATMVVCSRALRSLALGLEKRYGIPWFEGSFYGVRAMNASLRQFADILGRQLPPEENQHLHMRTESAIAHEESRIDRDLAKYRQRLTGVRAVVYTGGVKSWSMISALQDIGIEVVASGATKSTKQDIARMRELMDDEGQIITKSDPAGIIQTLRDNKADILVAGGRNQYTAVKSHLPFLDVNQERHVPLAGYRGVIELARRIDLTLSNPVWDVIQSPAPWDMPGETSRLAVSPTEGSR